MPQGTLLPNHPLRGSLSLILPVNVYRCFVQSHYFRVLTPAIQGFEANEVTRTQAEHLWRRTTRQSPGAKPAKQLTTVPHYLSRLGNTHEHAREPMHRAAV